MDPWSKPIVDYIGAILGLYGVITRLYSGYNKVIFRVVIGLYFGYIERMEKNMETTIYSIIGYMLGL